MCDGTGLTFAQWASCVGASVSSANDAVFAVVGVAIGIALILGGWRVIRRVINMVGRV